MKNLFETNEHKYRKKLKRLRIAFVILLLLTGLCIYKSFDYYAFKFLMTQNYIYTSTLDTMYDEALGEGNYNGYNKNFDEVMFYVFTNKIQSINKDKYTYLYNPSQYKKIEDNKKTEARETTLKEVSKDTIYIKLTNISKYTYEFLDENKEGLNRYNNIIIDLQDNSGGDLKYLYKMEEMFLDKGNTLGFETLRISFFSKEFKAKGEKELDFENIILLQNGSTASAAEGFITCLDENLSNVTKIGSTSFGKGIGQIIIPFTSGYAMKATILSVETPKYNSIHGVGIKPDIVVDKEDDVIDVALSHLHQQ